VVLVAQSRCVTLRLFQTGGRALPDGRGGPSAKTSRRVRNRLCATNTPRIYWMHHLARAIRMVSH
jgi:hypothetical protein